MRRRGAASAVLASWSFLLACAGGGAEPVAGEPTVVAGDDWRMPEWVEPVGNSGFFSEELSPDHHVDVRVVDLTWAQLEPNEGEFDTSATGGALGLAFGSWDDQLALDAPYWLRIWATGTESVPAWVVEECGLEPVGAGYWDPPDEHYAIWDPCLWDKLRRFYERVLVTEGLRDDERLRFAYVPGGFTYGEFDFEIMNQAVAAGDLEYETFDAWFQQAIVDLTAMMGDQAHKLVYTGEDYPHTSWNDDTDSEFLARDAVEAGMGIRTGITEVFNSHLNHVPAYGTTVADDGHMVTDDEWLLFDGRRVAATENECYTDCGFETTDPYYVVRMSNLKALQLRMNWIYVVPSDSYLDEYPELWEWVRVSLGQRPDRSPDAWAALRDAEDTFFAVNGTLHDWPDRPFVRNYERWLVQRDVVPDGVLRRGTDERGPELDESNGIAYETLSTDVENGVDAFYFDLDDTFANGLGRVEVKVTFRDLGGGGFHIEYPRAGGGTGSTAAVAQGATGEDRTATFPIDDASFDGSFADATDFRIQVEGDDLEVRFVRVVRVDPPPG